MISSYSFFYGFALGIGNLFSPFNQKLKKGLRDRVGLKERVIQAKPKDNSIVYWCHVASSGELEQAIPVLDELKLLNNEAFIFLSYFSPTAKRGIELEKERRQKVGKKLPWNYSDYSPLDFEKNCNEIIQLLNPKLFIVINREIWPNLLRCMNKNKVPSILLAAFFSISNRKRLGFYRKYLGYFDFIGTIDQNTSDFLRKLIPDVKIEKMGDPRIDRVILRKKMAEDKPTALSVFFPNNNLLIFASTWKKDTEKIIPALAILKESLQDKRILIVPHEPNENFIHEIKSKMAKSGIQFRLFSHWLLSPDTHSHLIVDKVGLLAELYRYSKIVFVGGSFKKRVHNILEPAAYGCALITGPFIQNSNEALELSKMQNGLITASNSIILAQKIKELLENDNLLDEHRKTVQNYILETQVISKRAASLCLDLSNKK